MMQAWVRVFSLDGWTAADLMEASDRLARSDKAPEHVSQHLARLQRTLHSMRRERDEAARKELEANSPKDGPASDCTICDNYGHLYLYHVPTYLATLRIVEWKVACRCALGKYQQAKREELNARQIKRDRPSLGPLQGLEEFEELQPDWREVLAEHRAYRRALVAAQAEALGLTAQSSTLVEVRPA